MDILGQRRARFRWRDPADRRHGQADRPAAVPCAHRRCGPLRLRRQGRLCAGQSGDRAGTRRFAPGDRGISRPPLAAGDQPLQAKPLGLALLQGRADFADFDRPSDDPGIERGIVVLQFLDCPGAGDAPRDARGEHFEMERLGDDIVGAGAESVDRARTIAAAGDQDDGRVLERGVVADPAGQLDPADRAHAQLAQHQVDRGAKHFGGGIAGIVAGDDPIAQLAQPLRQYTRARCGSVRRSAAGRCPSHGWKVELVRSASRRLKPDMVNGRLDYGSSSTSQ